MVSVAIVRRPPRPARTDPRVFACSLYTATDYIPVVAGMMSLVCWIFALLPQLLANYRNKVGRVVSSAWALYLLTMFVLGVV